MTKDLKPFILLFLRSNPFILLAVGEWQLHFDRFGYVEMIYFLEK